MTAVSYTLCAETDTGQPVCALVERDSYPFLRAQLLAWRTTTPLHLLILPTIRWRAVVAADRAARVAVLEGAPVTALKPRIRETKYLIVARMPRAGTVLASAQRAGLRATDQWVGWAVRAGDGHQRPLKVEIVDNVTEARELVEEWAAEELAAIEATPADDVRVVTA